MSTRGLALQAAGGTAAVGLAEGLSSSAIGVMHRVQHACKVIKPGRAFLRRMIDLLWIPGATCSHHIRLN